jgi:hypothetical protein
VKVRARIERICSSALGSDESLTSRASFFVFGGIAFKDLSAL